MGQGWICKELMGVACETGTVAYGHEKAGLPVKHEIARAGASQATTATPAAMASRMTQDWSSWGLVDQSMSKCGISLGKSPRRPRKCTKSAMRT